MRILVTGFTANYGGVETFVMNYYIAMKKIDKTLEFDIVSTASEPAFKDEIIAMGGNVHLIPRARNKAKVKNELARIMTENKYDVFWCNKCDLSDITFIQEAYKHKIPMRILHSHNSNNLYTGLKNKIVQFLHNKNKISKYATNNWACSDYAAKWMFEDASDYLLVPNAIDTLKLKFNQEVRDEYREKLKISNKLVIGCVARISSQKNPEFIIDTFKEIHNSNPNAVLIWAGIGELMDTIKKKVFECNLEQSVQFLGVRRDVDKLMQAMDCLLVPSKFEGLGIVIIEAQAAGLHCVISKDVIPKDVDITPLVTRVSLDSSSKVWANEVLSIDLEHRDTYEEMKLSGFDINKTARELLNEFIVARDKNV